MKIKVLLVMPYKEVQIIKIPASLKFIKSFIGKNLFKIKLSDNNILIANKDANFDEFNRIVGENIVIGTFLIISIKNNRMISMNKKNIRRYTNIFKLRKHQNKIEFYKNEYLEEYYTKQREIRQKNYIYNKGQLFNIAA